jgi:hypothetical protein
MKIALRIGLGIVLAACSSDDGGQAGEDVLPKRGERSSDPTIVAATASCEGDLGFMGLVINLSASDPMGQENLGTCAATVDDTTRQSAFAGRAFCPVNLVPMCEIGTDYDVVLTVSNKTGGVTTARIRLHP